LTIKVIAVAIAVAASNSLYAQQPGQDISSNARVHIGPLALNPTLALTNLGVDDNVFDQSDADKPKSDFTMTVTPATEAWLRMGPTWLTGNVKEDLVYYQDFASERSANTTARVGWLAPLNRLRVQANANYVNTRERPGFEIDERARRLEYGSDGGAEARLFSRTFFGGRAEWRKIDFNKGAEFLGVDLRTELTRTVTTAAVTARHELTPMTSLVAEAAVQHDRFAFSSLRDTDSTRVMAGVRFDPFALVSGSATVGYRSFRPLTAGMPAYHGLASDVSLSYTALGTTRLIGTFARDVQYSYDINQPFYVQTGGMLTAQQQIYGPFDMTGKVGAYGLSYLDRLGADIQNVNRNDAIRVYGAGAGYHAGRDLRIGFSVEQYHRTSVIDSRRYNALRYGLNVTYGL